MSKLGLGRAKLASSISSAFGPPPPDKKRKTDNNVATESAWDDDLDILLTQNMNKLDSLVASTQAAIPTGFDNEFASNRSDWSHHISTSPHGIVPKIEANEVCSVTNKQTVSSTGKRLIGHGGSHSRSADCINNSPAGSSVCMTRTNSFTTDKSGVANKESEKQQFFNSFQAKEVASFSSDSTGAVKNLPSVTVSALDANANCTETKLIKIAKECDYYKAEVCVPLQLL